MKKLIFYNVSIFFIITILQRYPLKTLKLLLKWLDRLAIIEILDNFNKQNILVYKYISHTRYVFWVRKSVLLIKKEEKLSYYPLSLVSKYICCTYMSYFKIY